MEKRKVPLLDMGALHRPIRAEVLAAMERVVDSNHFILGEDVGQLEKSIAAYCHVPYACLLYTSGIATSRQNHALGATGAGRTARQGIAIGALADDRQA